MSNESHFEVRRAREMLEQWRARAARIEKRKKERNQPTFYEVQTQQDIGYLLLVMKNLESGYYARRSSHPRVSRAQDHLGYFTDRARSDEQRELLRRQWREIHKLPVNTLECASVTCPCGKIRSAALAFRCLYCGVFFCAACAENHFGMTQQQHDQPSAP